MKKENTFQSDNLTIQYFIDLENSNFPHKSIFQNQQKSKPWQILKKIPDYLSKYFQKNHMVENQGQIVGIAYIDDKDVHFGEGTIIQHGAMIKSPCIIGKNCEIRKGAYLRGNVIIGDNVIIGNSSQIKNSIIFNKCQIPHFNYVGDSILGTKAHLSAGAMTSNFRLDGKSINITVKNQQLIKTDMKKFGAIIGDGAQIGCNVVLNPGSLVGRNSWIYPNVSFRGFLQSNKILKLKQQHTIEQKKPSL